MYFEGAGGADKGSLPQPYWWRLLLKETPAPSVTVCRGKHIGALCSTCRGRGDGRGEHLLCEHGGAGEREDGGKGMRRRRGSWTGLQRRLHEMGWEGTRQGMPTTPKALPGCPACASRPECWITACHVPVPVRPQGVAVRWPTWAASCMGCV